MNEHTMSPGCLGVIILSCVPVVGIDVGGSNTDAALIICGEVAGTAKVPTDPDSLIHSTAAAFEEALQAAGCVRKPFELHLSTTLSTNAIVEGRGDPTLALAVPGPGMRVEDLGLRFPIQQIAGSIDHRGRVTGPVDMESVHRALRAAADRGVTALSIAGKFSHRNPCHELQIEQAAQAGYPEFTSVTTGHRVSGRSNFPRRLATAYLNASIARQQGVFVEMVEELMLRERGAARGTATAIGKAFLLKANGGTMRLAESARRPIEAILSGPAASTMGALALAANPGANAAVIDIGGTTTDISVLVAGIPVFDRLGAVISGHRTLVPALFSRSIGLGGDSEVRAEQSAIRIGPRRAGTPTILGGTALTPTDAATALGLAAIGASHRHLGRAVEALAAFGEPIGLAPMAAAEAIVSAFAAQLAAEIDSAYRQLESAPVYTVSEMLAPRDIRPRSLIGLGAPAPVFVPRAAALMGLSFELLPHHAAANAVGAAASRPTASITLHADTALGTLTIPEAGYSATIPLKPAFDLKRARAEALSWAGRAAVEPGLDAADDASIVEEESFNVVRGFRTVGHIYSIKAQVRPEAQRIGSLCSAMGESTGGTGGR